MQFATNKEKGNLGLGIAIAYLLPTSVIENKSTITLGDKYEKYKVTKQK